MEHLCVQLFFTLQGLKRSPKSSSWWCIFLLCVVSFQNYVCFCNFFFTQNLKTIEEHEELILIYIQINSLQLPPTSHLEACQFVAEDLTAQLCLRIVQWLEGLASKALELESKVIIFVPFFCLQCYILEFIVCWKMSLSSWGCLASFILLDDW